jgi:hypothetical protein
MTRRGDANRPGAFLCPDSVFLDVARASFWPRQIRAGEIGPREIDPRERRPVGNVSGVPGERERVNPPLGQR